MIDDATAPAEWTAPDDFITEQCPHCPDGATSGWIPRNRVDEHVATAHADLPPCEATFNSAHQGTLTCVFRAWHAKGRGEYGEWHASARNAPGGRFVWRDDAKGATPHQISKERL